MKKTRMTPNNVLITHARGFTADPHKPHAEAVLIQGDRIAFVGSAEQAHSFCPADTHVIDAQGCTLMPGFIDSHFHLLLGSLQLAAIQLDQVKTLEEFIQAVRTFAAAHPTKEWLEGHGLLYSIRLPQGETLNRHHLDMAEAQRPLVVVAYDGHTAWANTVALERAGILHGRELPPGNEIVMGQDGKASGELREPAALAPISDLIPEPDAVQKQALLKQGLALAAQAGITSVHNMDGDLEQLQLYTTLLERAEMTLRIYLPFTVTPEMPLEALAEAQAMQNEASGNVVRAGCVKFFIDGVIESYTGLLVDEYADQPGYCGEAQFSAEDYLRLTSACDRLGLQIFTHSVGDGGVRRVLDTYEAISNTNPPRQRRHRVEHIELLHPADLPRFQQLGVIASMQPAHCPLSVSDPDPWRMRAGRQRWQHSFAWSDVRRSGAVLVFGSDWPVVTLNPMRGLYAALCRQPWEEGLPHHRQTLTDALHSYTNLAAYAEFMENEKGMLRKGMLADLVLLDANLETLAPQEIEKVRPVLTMCDGQIVFEG